MYNHQLSIRLNQLDMIAPGCSGVVLPIFFGSQEAARPTSQLDLARAITFALEQGVAIINVSAGQRVIAPDAPIRPGARNPARPRVRRTA